MKLFYKKSDEESTVEELIFRYRTMQMGFDAMNHSLFHHEAFAKGNGYGHVIISSSNGDGNHFRKTLYNFIK